MSLIEVKVILTIASLIILLWTLKRDRKREETRQKSITGRNLKMIRDHLKKQHHPQEKSHDE